MARCDGPTASAPGRCRHASGRGGWRRAPTPGGGWGFGAVVSAQLATARLAPRRLQSRSVLQPAGPRPLLRTRGSRGDGTAKGDRRWAVEGPRPRVPPRRPRASGRRLPRARPRTPTARRGDEQPAASGRRPTWPARGDQPEERTRGPAGGGGGPHSAGDRGVRSPRGEQLDRDARRAGQLALAGRSRPGPAKLVAADAATAGRRASPSSVSSSSSTV